MAATDSSPETTKDIATADDNGRPCWIVQNSYGELSNDSCIPGPHIATPELRAAYAASKLNTKRGCVFVEMVNADLVARRSNTDLENNVLSFLPVVERPGLQEAGAPSGELDRSPSAANELQLWSSSERSEGGTSDPERSEGVQLAPTVYPPTPFGDEEDSPLPFGESRRLSDGPTSSALLGESCGRCRPARDSLWAQRPSKPQPRQVSPLHRPTPTNSQARSFWWRWR